MRGAARAVGVEQRRGSKQGRETHAMLAHEQAAGTHQDEDPLGPVLSRARFSALLQLGVQPPHRPHASTPLLVHGEGGEVSRLELQIAGPDRARLAAPFQRCASNHQQRTPWGLKLPSASTANQESSATPWLAEQRFGSPGSLVTTAASESVPSILPLPTRAAGPGITSPLDSPLPEGVDNFMFLHLAPDVKLGEV